MLGLFTALSSGFSFHCLLDEIPELSVMHEAFSHFSKGSARGCCLTFVFSPLRLNSAIFIGRSEYSVSMFKEDSLEKHWNVSFSDYTVHATKRDPHNYQFLHLASTSNGELATVDKFTGEHAQNADVSETEMLLL